MSRCEQDVFRLDVAVNDASAVSIGKRITNLRDDPYRFVDGKL
jgi:hypothetical protein